MLKKIGKSLLALLILVTGFQGFLETQASEVEEPKKLTNIKATGKSSENHPVELAFDGDKTTYWQSPQSVIGGSVPVDEYKYDHNRYIDITLDGTYDLSQIKIFNKEGGYYNYYIYASTDGDNYERIATKSNTTVASAEGDSIDVTATASYLRINMAYNSSEFTTNLSELEVYGVKRNTKVSEPTPIEVQNFDDSEWATKWDQFVSNEVYAEQKIITEMQAMVSRVIGSKYTNNFIFELRDPFDMENGEGNDVFELESVNGKIVIRGNDGVSLASGFNYYLKYFCNVDYNPIFTSSDMTLPQTLPMVDEKVIKDTMYDYRYALNFCTYSYSMSFWGWDEYEKFLDWAAMNGVNLVLDIVGQEEVLREFLSTYGYSDAEVRDYISGPAYFAWFYMQNLDSYGGPLPNDWFEQRTELGRKMHDRMQAFGIDPVIQGFSGMVPYDFAEKADIDANQVLDVGDWPGYKRPYMLRTNKPNSQEVSDIYKDASKRFYQAQKDVFGDISNYYAVDPFHEGGIIPGDMNIQNVYYQVQNQLFENNGTDSIWVMQQWQGGISSGKLNGLKDKAKAIVLDLQSDMNPQNSPMESTQTPWIWNMLHNFGGRMGMDGEVEVIANKIPEAMAKSNYMVGIGITPEAIENSPIVYELLFDMTWEKDPINYKEWTYKYAQRRYNIDEAETAAIDDMKTAYDILLNTVYADKDIYIQGAAESVVNARPGMRFGAASTWGHSTIPYDKEELEKAVNLFATHYDELKNSPAFVYDFTDLLEQVLSNSAVEYHKLMVKAYEAKDKDEFTRLSTHFLDLIKLSDQVLGSSEKFLLGSWIDDARTMLDNDSYQMDDWSRDLFEFNARGLITTWGAQKNNSLKDYSNRKWAGLTSDFYLQRWSIWVNNRIANLEGKSANDPNWFLWEWQWANRKSDGDSGFTTEVNNLNLKEAADTIMKDFSMTNIDDFVSGGAIEQKVNIAINKPIEANFAPTSGNTANLVDNNTGSNFIYAKSDDNVIMEMDLNGIAQISEFALAFNQGAGIKPFTYIIEYLDPETSQWVKVAEDMSGELEANETIPFKCSASKIRYTFKTKDLANKPLEITELYVYGKMIKEIEYINYALGMPVTTTGTPQDGKPAGNVTDGKLNTIWVENNGVFGENTNVVVDLQATRNIEFIEICFEKAGLPFQYKVIANPGDADESIILDNSQSKDATPAKVSIPYNKDVRKIKVVLTGKNNAGEFLGAWPAIAEVRALAQKKNDTIEFNVGENVALHKNVTVPEGEDKKHFIVDGIHNGVKDRWERGAGTYPTEITVDLGGTYYLDEVNAGMEGEGYGFKYKLEIIDKNGERVLIADRSVDGDLAVADKYVHIPVDAMAQKVIYTLMGSGIGTAQAAWPCLSELQAIAGKPNTLTRDASITSNLSFTELEHKKLIDDNPVTSLALNESGTKEFEISLPNSSDIDMFELVKGESVDNPLLYKVYYKNTAQEWVELIDQSKNSKDKVSNTYFLDNVIRAKDFKFVILNENVTLSDINIFEGVATGPLKTRIGYVKGVLASKKIGDFAGYYPQSAADALQVALTVAQAKVDANINADEVTIAVSELNRALEIFLAAGPIFIDRGALTEILSKSETVLVALTKTNNTVLKESLQAAYDGAKVTNAKTLVSQQELDQAATTLTTAYNANKAVLEAILSYQDVVTMAEKQATNTIVGDSDGNVPQIVMDEFRQAIAEAKTNYQSSGNNVDTILSIQTALQEKIDAFKSAKVTVNKAQLQAVIDIAASKQRTTYTTTSWKEFEVAYTSASKILVGSNVSQAQVNTAKDALQTASNNLKSKGNTDALTDALYTYVTTYDKAFMSSASLTAYEEGIAQAQAMVNNNTDATIQDVEDMKISLENVVKALLGNKEKLQTLVDEQSALVEADYTTSSWKSLQDALVEAKEVLAKTEPTYVETKDAYDNVVKAVEELNESSDKSTLEDLITSMTDANYQETYFTASTWEVFTQAMTSAKAVVADVDATTSEVADATDALQAAYDALLLNKDALQTMINEQNALVEADYTPSSWNVLKTAMQTATTILAQSNIVYADFVSAYDALVNAIENLEIQADKSDLTTLLQTIDAQALVESDYTSTSWLSFKTAYDKALEVIADENASSTAISEAYTALQTSHAGLIGDVTSLQALIDAQADVKEEDYSSTTWTIYAKALQDAKDIIAKDSPTLNEIKTAYRNLENGIAQLSEIIDAGAVQKVIDDYTAENLVETNYTKASWQTYQQALTDTKALLKQLNVRPSVLKQSLKNLILAHDGLVDVAPLQNSVKQIDDLIENTYTKTSWNNVISAKQQAESLLSSTNVIDSEMITAMIATIDHAINTLVNRSDNTTLQTYIDELTADSALVEGNYSPASWAIYVQARQLVDTILTDNSDVSQEQANSALDALKTAYEGLVMQGNAPLKALIASVEELMSQKETYTSISWTVLDTAYTNAKLVVDASDSTQEQLNSAFATLKDAKGALVLRGDKTTLQVSYDLGSALLADEYTDASWKIFAQAFANAKVILDDLDATQAMVDTANTTLIEAMDSLVHFQSDKTALQVALQDALTFKEEQYTSATWLAFKPTYDQAMEINKKPKATQIEIDTATQNLRTAIMQLVKRGDKVELDAFIKKGESLQEATFVSSTWNVFSLALSEAKTVYANIDATQSDVDAVYSALTSAFDNLVVRGDKTALKEYIEFAKQVHKDEFSSTTWEAFAQAMNKAEETIANVDATGVQVQDALSAMKQAYGQLMKTHKPNDKVIVNGNDMEFTMDAIANAIDPRANLTVDVVEKPEQMEIFKTTLNNDTSKYVVFDISILLDGAKIQPNGSVILSMNVPNGYDLAKTKLFYIDENGVRHELAYRHENGKIYFETTHFSYYALAEMKDQEPTPSPTPTPTPTPTPQTPNTSINPGYTGAHTGDGTDMMMWLSFMVLSSACGYAMLKKRNVFK